MLERLVSQRSARDRRTCYDSAGMFEQNFGSRGTRWLKWFMAAMVIYAVTSLWPENRTVAIIGAVCAVVGIGIARRQIAKGRR